MRRLPRFQGAFLENTRIEPLVSGWANIYH